MNVLILSMVAQRDWIVDNMIADAVKAKGHDAVVRKFLRDDRTAIVVEKPDVCVIPPVRCEYSRDLAVRLKQWGVKVIARRSEAGVSRKQYDKLKRTWQLDHIGRYSYKKTIDLELVWSREFADILIDEGMVRPDQVRIIGGITLDPYFKWDLAENSAKVFTSNREEWLCKRNLDPQKRTLYFVTGFVHAVRPVYTLPEAPLGDPIHAELHQRDLRLRTMWIDAVCRFAETDRYNVILRPHHGEDHSVYDPCRRAGAYVSVEGSAGENLYFSDLLVHAGSTMAIEAHLLKKPAFSLGSTAQDDMIGDVSPYCDSIEELTVAIQQAVYGQSNAKIKTLKDLEKSFYGPIDGKAHQRCAEVICEFGVQDNKKIPNAWPEDELRDYTSPGVVKIDMKFPLVYCQACKKASQNMTGQISYRCPHCSIMITKIHKPQYTIGVKQNGKG